jgi:nucleotide-binding universal stress UspA family protein
MLQIHTILVPVDFSEHSGQALEYAIELAQKFEARLELLHCYPINIGGISPYGVVLPESFERDCREAANQQLEQWLEKARAGGVPVTGSVTPMFASEAIAQQAKESGADLIVMGTRGLTGLKHVLLGSVAERTLRIAPCNVLTVKSRALE